MEPAIFSSNFIFFLDGFGVANSSFAFVSFRVRKKLSYPRPCIKKFCQSQILEKNLLTILTKTKHFRMIKKGKHKDGFFCILLTDQNILVYGQRMQKNFESCGFSELPLNKRNVHHKLLTARVSSYPISKNKIMRWIKKSYNYQKF